MQIYNDGMSEALYQAIVKSQASYKRTGWLSTTSCQKPPRMLWLEKKYDGVITLPASFFLDSFIGTSMHKAIDGSMGEGHQEQEFTMEVCGVTFSGRPDVSRGEVGDFKFTKATSFVFSGGLKDEWVWQANINTVLARHNGVSIHGAWVECIFLDWNKWEAKRNADYPKSKVLRVPIELLPEGDVLRFMVERTELHLATEILSEGELPLCTEAEQWGKDTKWAVMKPNQKKAHRVFDDELEAKKEARGIAGAMVVKRPGEKTRCLNYCAAAQVCGQWKAECAADG